MTIIYFMRVSALYCILAVMMFSFTDAASQEVPRVSQPDLSIDNNRLIIGYTIQNCTPQDTFKVWIEVTDNNNNKINALSLTGDYGDMVPGGDNKKIIWDYQKDLVDINREISLQVCAELVEPVVIETDVSLPEADAVIESDLGSPEADAVSDTAGRTEIMIQPERQVSKKQAYLYSTLFPGLGFTKMNKSKLHLIKGFAGYTLLTSSILFNRMAISTYDDYLAEETRETRDNYFNLSQELDNWSEMVCIYAAVIWVADLIWLSLDPGAKSDKAGEKMQKLSFSPGLDAKTGTPTFGLLVRF